MLSFKTLKNLNILMIKNILKECRFIVTENY